MGNILSSAPYSVIIVTATGYSEDNELPLTADKNIIKRLNQFFYCPITVIGDILKEGLSTQIVLLDNKGRIVPCEGEGWDHFRDVHLANEITQP